MSTKFKVNYSAVRNEVQERHNKLYEDCGTFFAFSDEQFEEGKTKHPLQPGEKYVSIGYGGFMPGNNVDKLIAGQKAIKAYEKEALKSVKAEQVILYELTNFEAFYSDDITDALEVLKDMGYAEEQVRKVYNDNKHRLMQRYE